MVLLIFKKIQTTRKSPPVEIIFSHKLRSYCVTIPSPYMGRGVMVWVAITNSIRSPLVFIGTNFKSKETSTAGMPTSVHSTPFSTKQLPPHTSSVTTIFLLENNVTPQLHGSPDLWPNDHLWDSWPSSLNSRSLKVNFNYSSKSYRMQKKSQRTHLRSNNLLFFNTLVWICKIHFSS